MFYLISILVSLAIFFFGGCFIVGRWTNEFEYPRKVVAATVRIVSLFHSGTTLAIVAIVAALLVHPFAGGVLLFMTHEAWKLSRPAKPEQIPTDTPPTE